MIAELAHAAQADVHRFHRRDDHLHGDARMARVLQRHLL